MFCIVITVHVHDIVCVDLDVCVGVHEYVLDILYIVHMHFKIGLLLAIAIRNPRIQSLFLWVGRDRQLQ